MQEESIPEPIQLKSFKKQSIRPGIKEQIKEDQTKLKQQIFDNYNKVMTYKIHQEYPDPEKFEIEVPVKKKKLSIMQNIALTIIPSKEEAMKE